MTRAVIGRTVGALLCVALTVTLWVTALRALLAYARHGEFGAYIIAAFVFMLLPFGCLCFVALLLHDRAQSKPARPALPSVPPRRELPPAYSPSRIYRVPQASLAPNQAYALIERHGDVISIRPVQ